MRAKHLLGLVALLTVSALPSCAQSHKPIPTGTEQKTAKNAMATITEITDPRIKEALKHYPPVEDRVRKSDEEWKKELTPEQYRILRSEGTELACSGKLLNNKAVGLYLCAACGNPLFSSESKFESGTGWPSFYKPLQKGRIDEHVDNSWGMSRTETRCARCNSHLGHVFDDGPEPTGLRYCMNSEALRFVSLEK